MHDLYVLADAALAVWLVAFLIGLVWTFFMG